MSERWNYAPGETGAIELDELGSLKLQLGGGTVTIVGHAGTTARIEVTSVSGAAIEVDVSGASARIRHSKAGRIPLIDDLRPMKSASVNLAITVPFTTAVEFGGVSSDVVLSSLSGRLNASTVGGRLTLDGCTGKTSVNAVNGEICALDHDGDLDVNTVSGDVTIAGSLDVVSVNSVSAAVHLDLSGRQQRIAVNQATGDITLRLATQPITYTINSLSGATVDGTHLQEKRKSVIHSIPGENPAAAELNSGLGRVTITHVEES